MSSAALDLSSYVFEALGDDGELRVARGRRPDAPTVLAVTPAVERPSASTLARLQRNFALRDELAAAAAATPIALVHHDGRLTLVVSDPGGAMLARLADKPMEVNQLLRIAIGLAGALGRLHARNIVHRDVKPASIMVDESTGQAWLGIMGLSLHVPRHRRSSEPPSTMAGTLAYMAPEQTGRTNRTIDPRSDLYAYGVTLYELITGNLPFRTSDPSELVHCHLARKPVAPSALRDGFPDAVSSIVTRLLAKAPEDRYQSAAGVEADLRRCLADWKARGRIEPFSLGGRDVPDRLMAPERLYGREPEIHALLSEFESLTHDGGARFVLVSGDSGAGKSSIVNALQTAIVQRRGFFASGKADRNKRDIPFATLALALQDLVGEILRRTEEELGRWRGALVQVLGASGQLLVNLVPDLEHIVGPQPPVRDLSARDAHLRFRDLVQRFLGVFAQREHPLTLFLDDIHWTDAATFELIAQIATAPGASHLMIVGAFRSSEVAADHALARCSQSIRAAGIRLCEVSVGPMAARDVTDLVADMLRCDRERAGGLGQLVHAKTEGNPFYAIEFLFALAEQQLLLFDRVSGAWRWDLAQIRAMGSTDSLIDLMSGKAARLPPATRDTLKLLACLGHAAHPATLAWVQETSEEAVHVALSDAAREGLVSRRDAEYVFAHDRVQEAAYALVAEEDRAAEHLSIGRRLAARATLESPQEQVFDIAYHLNRGSALVTAPCDRQRIAELNLTAGRLAKSRTAQGAALAYLSAGQALLTDDALEQSGELAFALDLERAGCELHLGYLDPAEERLSMLWRKAESLTDRAAVARLRMSLYTTRNRPDRAVEVGLECLRSVGVDWSAHPTDEDVKEEYARMWRNIGVRSIESLAEAPVLDDAGWRAVLDDVALDLGAPALFTDRNLFLQQLAGTVNIMLEHGHCNGSAWIYAVLGMVMGSCFGDHSNGLRFGQLGLTLAEKQGLDRFRARAYVTFGHHIIPWVQHIRGGNATLRRAVETMQSGGDLTFLAYSRNHMVTHMWASGEDLAEVEREAEEARTFARASHFAFVADDITAALALVNTLRGNSPVFGRLGEEGNEDRIEQVLKKSSSYGAPAFRYWVRKLVARFFAADYATAVVAAAHAEPLLWSSPRGSVPPWFLELIDHRFYGALAIAGYLKIAPGDERPGLMRTLAAHHAWLDAKRGTCPENFSATATLVAAEIARIEGEELRAERLYEEAIRHARAYAFVQTEAVAHELAAMFYASRGLATAAQGYLHNARSCYVRWGANGKVRQLDETYPHLRAYAASSGAIATIETPIEQVDLATVLKVSNALSVEIVLEKLIHQLLANSVELAGAERGVLILSRGEQLQVAAEAVTSDTGLKVRLPDATAGLSELPPSVIQFVMRTGRRVLLDDAQTTNQFSADAYVQTGRCRSVLCLPLVKQTALVGVLYLENNLAQRAFTPRNASVLELLASHAAVSLDHARVFNDLARENQERRRMEATLAARLAFERLISDLSADIAETDTTSLNARIGVWLARIGELLDVDRAAFYEYSEETHSFDRTAFWNALDGRLPPTTDVGSVLPALVPMLGKSAFRYECVEDMPPDDRRFFTQAGIRSALGVPACVGRRELGYLVLGATHVDHAWSNDLVQRLRVITEIFANGLARRRAEHDKQVKLELERALEFRELVIGILGHDLRSPLSAAAGLTQLVMRTKGLPVDATRRLAAVGDSLERMNRLVATLLDFTESRFKGMLSIAPAPTDLAAICARLAEELMASRHERGIEVRAAGPMLGEWDPVRVEQVVSNLFANALTHGTGAQPIVAALRADGEHVVLEVTNKGTPIPPDELRRLFEPFRRGPTRERDRRRGLGLGLYIVRQIVQAHAGSVSAESTEQGGTVFTVRLPTHSAHVSRLAARA